MTARAGVLAAVLLSACATARPHAAPSAIPASSVAPCGFEAPYLPDPCRMEVAPGEWLVIRNPAVKPASRPRWWWALLVIAL